MAAVKKSFLLPVILIAKLNKNRINTCQNIINYGV